MNETEDFWKYNSYLVVTDNTKPAMKWTIEELNKRGKKVFKIDLSAASLPEKRALIENIPPAVDAGISGVTTIETSLIVDSFLRHGINRIWIHWRTEDSGSVKKCMDSGATCIVNKCPVMYLSKGVNIHTIHRGLAKIIGKY